MRIESVGRIGLLGLSEGTPLALSTAVSPGAVRDTACRCRHVAFHQRAEGLTDARAARWLHGFPGAPGLPDLRGAGESDSAEAGCAAGSALGACSPEVGPSQK